MRPERELPGGHDLLRADLPLLPDPRERPDAVTHLAGSATGAAERAPREEGDPMFGTVAQLVDAAGVLGRELVLHAREVAVAEHQPGDLDLFDARVGDAHRADETLLLQR